MARIQEMAPKSCEVCEHSTVVKNKVRVGDVLAAVIKKMEDKLKEADFKASLGDYLKLVQLEKEIGDDALGHANESDYTHGTSAQRMRWFRRGFDGGDARQCDTFAVTPNVRAFTPHSSTLLTANQLLVTHTMRLVRLCALPAAEIRVIFFEIPLASYDIRVLFC